MIARRPLVAAHGSALRRHRALPAMAAATVCTLVLLVSPSFAAALPQQETGAAPARQSNDAALTAFRSGRYEEAINAWRQRIRSGNDEPADHRNLVRALAEVGRYEQAEDAARAFIADNPISPELHNVLGEVLWATGHLDEAEAAYRHAIDGRATDRLTAEVNLAIAAFDRGRRDEAMQRFDRFIDYYNNGQATTSAQLTAVGIACEYLGIDRSEMFKDALKAFDEAVAADPNDLRPRILTGELFLHNFQSGDAATELQAVLQLNPQQPEALLAMGKRMLFDNEPNASAMVDSALQTNPDMVEAKVFRARSMLTAERYDEAIIEVEEALEVNPASLDALAVLATAHYLRSDMPAFERARDRALALNPGYADLYNTLADMLVQNRHYAQAVDFARQAVTLDPQSWDGYAILGINQLRIGEIEAGKASLAMAFSGAPYNVGVMNTLDLLDTFPDYVESSTERFDLMIEGGPEADLLSLYVGELAEDAYDYFEQRYDYSPPTPIRIEVYPSHQDFSVRTVGLTGLGALGVSFGPVIAIDSPSARPIGEFNWGTTLWHEIAHTFTLGVTDFRIPRWVSEGLSVYEERRARPSWGDDVTASFLIAFQRGMLQPVSRITDGLVRPAYPEQVIHSYFQASMVCELIERDWGFDGILALLDAYKRGLDTDQAFEEVLGMDAVTFDQAFDDYIAETYAGPLAALADGGEEGHGQDPRASGQGLPSQYLREAAEREPGSFRTQLAYGAALVDEERYDDAVPYLERAKDLFPQYAEADSPYAYLALIAREQGDLRRAAEELEALTDINENLYQANSRLADIYIELDEPEHAAAALERLVWIYPLEIDMHQRLAALYEETGNNPLAIRERRAVVALAPVDMAEAWYRLARAQYEGGEMSNARTSVLRSLEIAPAYPEAQELLLTIVGGQEER